MVRLQPIEYHSWGRGGVTWREAIDKPGVEVG